MSSCANTSACDGIIEVRDYIDTEAIYYGRKYAAEVPYNQTVSFYTSWVAKDETLLDIGKEHIQFFLEIDDNSYLKESFINTAPYTSDEDNESYPSYFLWVKINGWKVGEDHDIRLGFLGDKVISDGWEDYYPGQLEARISQFYRPLRHRLYGTPTLQRLRKQPSWTFRPTPAVPSRRSSITIINNTEGGHALSTLVVRDFSFRLLLAHTTISVCPGACTIRFMVVVVPVSMAQ